MEAHVSLEVVFEAETQPAGLTYEGFLSRVDYSVLQQAHPTLKGFIAFGALVGPRLRV